MVRTTSMDNCLNNAFFDELCDEAGVPDDRRNGFKRAMRSAVRRYLNSRGMKSSREAEGELQAINRTQFGPAQNQEAW